MDTFRALRVSARRCATFLLPLLEGERCLQVRTQLRTLIVQPAWDRGTLVTHGVCCRGSADICGSSGSCSEQRSSRKNSSVGDITQQGMKALVLAANLGPSPVIIDQVRHDC